MTASVQDSRLKRRFQLWDANGDGKIDWRDYEVEAHRILHAFGEHENSRKGRRLMDAYRAMWEGFCTRAGIDPDGSIDEEQFVAVADQQVVLGGDTGFDRSLRPSIEAIVDVVDTDGDGHVDQDEFRRWFTAVGVHDRQADHAFREIDEDDDKRLSVEELVAAVRDYHQGKNDIALLGR